LAHDLSMDERTWNTAPFEKALSERSQFELLTLLAWASWLLTVAFGTTNWRHTHEYIAFGPALLHLSPWVTAALERRRISKLSTVLNARDAVDSKSRDVPFDQSLIRLLWAAYAALWALEYGYYFVR
jgi:hypothetical protein